MMHMYFRNTTVDLSHIDTPPNMSAWPHFHNGVAAGLRIADFSQVVFHPVARCHYIIYSVGSFLTLRSLGKNFQKTG